MKKLSLAQIVLPQTRIRLVAVWLVVLIFLVFGETIMGDGMSNIVAAGIFLVLLLTIIGAAFGVVREADELAHKLGEPYGTLILTLSIVAIEVILISAIMLGPGENPTIGKDSIFSVMMIIMNFVIGLSILLGTLKFGEQEYNSQGTISYLSMIILLGGIGLMLPNYIEGAGDGVFSRTQTIVLSFLIIVLYGFFLAFQIKKYSYLYVQPKAGFLENVFPEIGNKTKIQSSINDSGTITKRELWVRSVVLIAMILPIVLLSHHMAVVVDYFIDVANLPPLLGGVLIAVIVFMPESITAIKAAMNNQFQRTINLCHGAFLSTVGLTIPSVLIIGLIQDKTVLFGLTPIETLLFVITILLNMMTFAGKRTTPIVGLMHLVLFAVFILLIISP